MFKNGKDLSTFGNNANKNLCQIVKGAFPDSKRPHLSMASIRIDCIARVIINDRVICTKLPCEICTILFGKPSSHALYD